MAARTRSRGPFDYWPGFVDVLSTLLLVITFMLSIFMLGQYFLGQQLNSRDATIDALRDRIADLANQLGLVKKSEADLTAEMNKLRATLAETEARAAEAAAAKAALEQTGAALTDAEAELALLNQQVEQLRLQLLALQEALGASEAKNRDAQVEIEDLGRRLNEALAEKVKELADYRSEFFGRLKEILADRPDIKISGDRFVFQSEVLFAVNSAELSEQARSDLSALADALKEIMGEIPADIDWVLRVDGHSDKRPISTPEFPSNLHLSAARSIAVVRFLVAMGVPANRLAATGFGDQRPVDTAETDEAYARNRRIEFKLTEP
ncbi:MAG: peptidoglycan -binding protein [Alphaproteobacteria bacterium]|nr:peptidoglycan -binding protein [Alphaproteobacteria bacterium]